MNEPVWLERAVILAIHDEQLAEHGGLSGLRDAGALDSALARPQQKFAYGNGADLAALAAAYGFGIAKNHPFADGNKRTAFVAIELFLALNGLELIADDERCVLTILALAAGELAEDALADWLRSNSVAAPTAAPPAKSSPALSRQKPHTATKRQGPAANRKVARGKNTNG